MNAQVPSSYPDQVEWWSQSQGSRSNTTRLLIPWSLPSFVGVDTTIRHLAISFITRGVLHLRTLELYEREVLKHAHLKVWPRLSANSVLLAVDEFHLGDILDWLQQSSGGNADELTALGCLINCRASSIYSTTSGVIDSFLWRLLH